MESKSIFLFVAVTVNLLHFGHSFGKFENISDCRYGPPTCVNCAVSYPNHLTIICGKTDNTSDIFNTNEIDCTQTANYRWPPTFDQIIKIDFENCLFRDINNDFLKNFTKLEEFDTSDVNLVEMSVKEPARSPFLVVFNASHNQLVALPSKLVPSIKSLTTLDVSYNAISEIGLTDLVGAGHLTVLNISHNNLLEIPFRLFLEATKLRVANFSANKIERVHSDAFIDAKNLSSLDLSHNRLKSLVDHLFDDLRNLEYLSLAYNPIGNLKIDALAYLTNLEHLDLKQTNISTIVLGTFSFQSKLISLDLSDNQLARLNFGLFLPTLRHLQSLRLTGNQLQDLYGFKNALFPQLSSLDIKNNRFTCDYLKRFMESISWDNIDIPVDPNAIDRQKTSIRGINCETTFYSLIEPNEV